MTYNEVVHETGQAQKRWYYGKNRTYPAMVNATAIRNKFGVFYFSGNTLIGMVPGHKNCPQTYRNKLYVVENFRGRGAIGRHLNLLQKDKSKRVSFTIFRNLYSVCVINAAHYSS